MLDALYNYYHRLALDSELAKVPSYGFSDEEISYIIILGHDGNILDIVPNLTNDNKPKPKLMRVPQSKVRTSGKVPFFLWDKTKYVFGVTKAGKNEVGVKLCINEFNVFRKFHLQLLQNELQLNIDPGLTAFCLFLMHWQPENFMKLIGKSEILDTNIIFQLDGARHYIHESTLSHKIWLQYLEDKSLKTPKGNCLISGEIGPIALIHQHIKGVKGGHSSGGALVTFNKDSFTSYGKKKEKMHQFLREPRLHIQQH